MSHSETAPASLPSAKGVHLTLALIALAAVVLALAVKTFGMVALTMAALPLVPVMFIFFICISLP